MSACRSCNTKILWAKSVKSGKLMPIDIEPAKNGNLYLQAEGFDPPLAFSINDTPPMAVRPGRFVSHFATCPEARQHRRAR